MLFSEIILIKQAQVSLKLVMQYLDVTTLHEFSDAITSNFSIYIMSFGQMTITGNAYVHGARVGICADSLQIDYNSTVSADHLGCESLEGRGSMLVSNGACSSPGASYGGRGGFSTNIRASKSRVRPINLLQPIIPCIDNNCKPT